MLDIKRIRTDFDAVAEKLATRGVNAAILNEMKEIDAKRRDILVKVETLKAERNTVSAEIAKLSGNKENADDKIAAMQTLSAEVKALDAELAEIDAKLTEFTTTLPKHPLLTAFLLGLTKMTMWKFAVGVLHASSISSQKLTGIWVKTLASLTGNVVVR